MFTKKHYYGLVVSTGVILLLLLAGSINAPKASSDDIVPRAYLPLIVKGFSSEHDSSRFNFETDNQSWWPDSGSAAFRVERVTNYAYQGNYSLRVDFIDLNGGTEPPNGKPANMRVWSSDIADYGPGTTIVAHVLLPPGSPTHLRGLIFVQDADYTWIPSTPKTLVTGVWNTLTFTLPGSAQSPIRYTGIQLYNPTGAGSWSGSAYLDSINW